MHVAILSPHRDDAAFSCAYLILTVLRGGGRVTIWNVFTISDYAPYANSDHGGNVDAISALRRKEDLTFIDKLTVLLGKPAAVTLRDLDCIDMPLRTRVSPDEMRFARMPEGDEENLDLASRLIGIDAADIVFSPLALGGHPDHALVRRAVEKITGPEKRAYYEDLPYACDLTAADDPRGGCASGFKAFFTHFTDTEDARLQLALCYPSQIPESEAVRMQKYSDSMGHAERSYGQTAVIDLLKTMI